MEVSQISEFGQMTRLLFINPNTTQSMTDKIQVAARQAAVAGVHVDALSLIHI